MAMMSLISPKVPELVFFSLQVPLVTSSLKKQSCHSAQALTVPDFLFLVWRMQSDVTEVSHHTASCFCNSTVYLVTHHPLLPFGLGLFIDVLPTVCFWFCSLNPHLNASSSSLPPKCTDLHQVTHISYLCMVFCSVTKPQCLWSSSQVFMLCIVPM